VKPTLEDAIQLAVQAHQGQRDRYGQPYILHPLRVMGRLHDETDRIVAVLHDVVEDTTWTFEELRRSGYSDEILEALDGVTRREGETYDAFVDRSAGNAISRRVKLADLEDNMEVRRMIEVRPEDAERLGRYLKAWRKLQATQPAR
jgi:(p)ppGpp synthase/HD superfamily hydrolase